MACRTGATAPTPRQRLASACADSTAARLQASDAVAGIRSWFDDRVLAALHAKPAQMLPPMPMPRRTARAGAAAGGGVRRGVGLDRAGALLIGGATAARHERRARGARRSRVSGVTLRSRPSSSPSAIFGELGPGSTVTLTAGRRRACCRRIRRKMAVMASARTPAAGRRWRWRQPRRRTAATTATADGPGLHGVLWARGRKTIFRTFPPTAAPASLTRS